MGNWVSNSVGISSSSFISNISWVCNSMGNWVSNNSGVGNGMSNWVSNNSRVSNSMGNWVSNSVGISSSSFISNIGNISIIIIGMIFDMLDTTIRKVDRVGTIYTPVPSLDSAWLK